MPTFDHLTLLVSHASTMALCMLMLGLQWQQGGRRDLALGWWFAGFSAQFVAVLFYLLRVVGYEDLSILGAAFFAVGGMILVLEGVAVFSGVRLVRRRFAALLLMFMVVHSYYTLVAASLPARNMNYAISLGFLCAYASALLWRHARIELKNTVRVVCVVLAVLAVISLVRIPVAFQDARISNMFLQGNAAALITMSYQLSSLALALSLLLLINKRLLNEKERELFVRNQSEAALRESEARLKRAELAAKVGNWELRVDELTISGSPGAKAIYGLSDQFDYATVRNAAVPEDRPAIDLALKGLIEASLTYNIQYQIRTPDTNELKDIHSVASFDRARRVIFGTITDITELKDHQRTLEKLARFDALTGLPNRSLLADRLQLAMAQSQRRQKPLAVAFLDLDGFKQVNDTWGHDIGDDLLIALAQRMKTALREGDTLARVGGDEFIALLVDLDSFTDCEQVLQRLLVAAAQPVELSGHTVQTSASIGVTLFPADLSEADVLIRHADQAMYQAKQAGRNQYRLHSDKAD
jgi:diguanylate cyclase (GGDEF)-like protein